jgi:hypothetical protein
MPISQSSLLQFRAKTLHAQGYPVDHIADAVGKSETTVYKWLHDMGVDVGANKPEPEIEQEVPEPIDKFVDGTFKEGAAAGTSMAQQDAYFRVVCALYWGEGRIGDLDDEDISEVSLASSDVSMVNIWLTWLQQFDIDHLIAVRIHVSQNNVLSDTKIESFWRRKLQNAKFSGEVDIKRIDQYVTSQAAKTKHGSAYVTVYSHYLRGLIVGGIRYLKSTLTK